MVNAGFIFCCSFLNESSMSHIIMLEGRSGQQEDIEGQNSIDRVSSGAEKSNCTIGSPLVSTFGADLLLVPTKLVKTIQEGEFVDVGELAIDLTALSPAAPEDGQ